MTGAGSPILDSDGKEPTATKRGRSVQPGRLKQRSDFLRAARGLRFHADAFTVQAVRRPAATDASLADEKPRIGFTATRKTGNAVERNRMRRRLKEALRHLPDLPARPDHDYVLVIRRASLKAAFGTLTAQLLQGFDRVHQQRSRPVAAPVKAHRGS